MTFKHLEDHLQDEKSIAEYFELTGNLKEPTKTVLHYALDIASCLNTRGLDDKYVVFGGYAVLSHLMDKYGSNFANMWRGSQDIDMAGTIEVLQTLKQEYDIKSDLPSPNIPNKRTIKLVEDSEKECKIDYSLVEEVRRMFSAPEIHFHLGIPLIVASPLRLIKGKLATPRVQPEHNLDIFSMIGVLESKGYSPESIVTHFDYEEKKELFERLKLGKSLTSMNRFSFGPEERFEKSLERELKRYT